MIINLVLRLPSIQLISKMSEATNVEPDDHHPYYVECSRCMTLVQEGGLCYSCGKQNQINETSLWADSRYGTYT